MGVAVVVAVGVAAGARRGDAGETRDWPVRPGAVAGEGPPEPGEETGGCDVGASNLLGDVHAHKGGGGGGDVHAHKGDGDDAGEDPAGGEVSGETSEIAGVRRVPRADRRREEESVQGARRGGARGGVAGARAGAGVRAGGGELRVQSDRPAEEEEGAR